MRHKQWVLPRKTKLELETLTTSGNSPYCWYVFLLRCRLVVIWHNIALRCDCGIDDHLFSHAMNDYIHNLNVLIFDRHKLVVQRHFMHRCFLASQSKPWARVFHHGTIKHAQQKLLKTTTDAIKTTAPWAGISFDICVQRFFIQLFIKKINKRKKTNWIWVWNMKKVM